MKYYFPLLFLLVTQSYAQSNVTFLSNLNQYPSQEYNDVWGYVDSNGIEYALLGCGHGTSIVNIDQPTQPQEVAFIPGPNSLWRDIKTHGTYAYIVTEGTGTGRGLQIVNLSQLPDTAILVNTIETWFTRAHNIFIDNGYAYVIGTDGGGGMHILNLSNPVNPVRTAYYTSSGYIHDVYVWSDTVVVCAGSSQIYQLVDVTNKSNPQLISSSQALPGIYAHSGWMTADKRYFIACEEFNVRDITVWDLVDRTSWDLVVPSWQTSLGSSIIHNLFVRGNFAHISYYTSGYVVLDISDPLTPVLAGHYDTYPQSNGGTYNGAWGCYPYLPSGNTLISDIETGLYVLRFDGDVQTFQLSVDVGDKWNVLSIPGDHPDGNTLDNWWPYRDPLTNVFYYNNGYQLVDTLVPGIGYWIKHNGARLYNTGDEWPAGGIIQVPHDPIDGQQGWNLIGGYEATVSTSGLTTNPPGCQSGPVYTYIPMSGYIVASDLSPGHAYWTRLISDCEIIIPELASKPTNNNQIHYNDFQGQISFNDAMGRTYTLYTVFGNIDISSYELPPVPPNGVFDIRFTSGKYAEDITSSEKMILLSGVEFPVTVKAEGINIKLIDDYGDKLNLFLQSGDETVINDKAINKLKVTTESLPIKYSLEQNFPNPFNPVTTISFALPVETLVQLNIFNSLGEKASQLVNGTLKPGYHQFRWNAESFASGIYIYELKANNFISTKKMILMK